MKKKSIRIPNTYKYISAFITFRCPWNCSYCLNDFDEKFKRKTKELTGDGWIKSLN